MTKTAIHRIGIAILVVASLALATTPARAQQIDSSLPHLTLHPARQSPLDLQVSGDLHGLTPGSTRYITRKELLALPQTTYTVTDDPNFAKPTKVSGVLLSELVARIAANPASDIAVAICSDKYRANYPRAYLAAHQPLLVLEVDGQPPATWPKDAETHTMAMGPYLISHPKYFPGSAITHGGEETQVPWGVVRIDFQNEKQVFASIEPRGANSNNAPVLTGYQIAKQNCFRCHNSGSEGGQKSGVPWTILATLATAAPDHFTAYVHNPQAQDPQAQMPPNPDFDDPTLHALTAYFQTFSPPQSENKQP
jgi:mono/diheme cytochrome c family protein